MQSGGVWLRRFSHSNLFASTAQPIMTFPISPRLRVKKLNEFAVLPTRGSLCAAGLDLYSCQSMTIEKHGRAVVPTGLSIMLPPNTYGRVAPRSGLAVKYGIDTGAGVIDSDYRGPVGVVLFNLGDDVFTVNRGDRIAQLIVEKIELPEVEEVEELTETVRGGGGFGSTGAN